MSDLPSGWASASVDEICQIVRGVTFPTEDKRHAPESGFVACLRTANVQTAVEWDDLWYVPELHVRSAEQYVCVGDTLISTANSFELVGKVSFVSSVAQRSTLGAFISLLRPEAPIDKRLFYFQLSSHDAQSGIRDMASTTTNISNVSGAKLKTLRLCVPPASEQTRIVAKLEELLSDLDAGVAELKAAQKKLAQYRQSLLKAAVEGALTAEWRRHNPPKETGADLLARILTERRVLWEARQLAKFESEKKAPPKDWRSKYAEPAPPETQGLPAIPVGWAWASAEQLCDFITKGTTPPKELDDGSEKVIPFLRVTNLTDAGVLDLADKVFVSRKVHAGFLARSVVYPDDVLMNIVGPPLGQVSVVPHSFGEWNINQAIAIFRAVEGVLSTFIAFYLLSVPAQAWLKKRAKTTAGQTNLTLEVCRSLPVPLPCLSEQNEIVSRLDIQLGMLSRQADSVQLALKQSTAQRQNILRAAFAGQLVPQDPNDEPASVLLERIRAEREASPRRGRASRKKKHD